MRRTGKPPLLLTKGEVRAFILERYEKLNGSSQRILYRGLRFLFNDLFKYDWQLLKAARARREIIEPAILSREEVARLLGCIKLPHLYMFLRTVYTCGLRLDEARQPVSYLPTPPTARIHVSETVPRIITPRRRPDTPSRA